MKSPHNLHNLKCTECGEILAYGIQTFPNTDPVYCYLCMLSIAEFGMLLGATKVPDKYDVYAMTHEDEGADAQKDRSKCRNVLRGLQK